MTKRINRHKPINLVPLAIEAVDCLAHWLIVYGCAVLLTGLFSLAIN